MNHNFDMALVGNNYLSYLLGLSLLNKGKKILLLDDERFNYGDFFTGSLSQLDLEFLKGWGKECELEPLMNLDRYLKLKPVQFFIGKKQVNLGVDPISNFRELARKFPEFFLEDSIDANLFLFENEGSRFNGHYFSISSHISNGILKDFKSKNLFSLLQTHLQDDLLKYFNFFHSHFLNTDKNEKLSQAQRNELNTLTYMFRGLFQSRLGISGNKTEIFHLFWCLLSPFYCLDHKALVSDLMKIHKEHGGEFKKMNLEALHFQSGIVQSFALESFEGMIRPKKMIFIGGYPQNLPIKLNVAKGYSYHCLRVEMKFKEEFQNTLIGKKFAFSTPIKIGTDRPFWEVEFGDKNTAVFNVIMNQKEGTKVEFIEKRVESILLDDLHYLYPEYEFSLTGSVMSFTHDILVEDSDSNAHKRKDKTIKKRIVNILADSTPLFMPKLKNAMYFGPYYDNWLGRYSSLIELRRWKEYL